MQLTPEQQAFLTTHGLTLTATPTQPSGYRYELSRPIIINYSSRPPEEVIQDLLTTYREEYNL